MPQTGCPQTFAEDVAQRKANEDAKAAALAAMSLSDASLSVAEHLTKDLSVPKSIDLGPAGRFVLKPAIALN